MRPADVIMNITNDLELVVDESPLVFSDQSARRIDELWAAEKVRRGENLYDAPIMFFEKMEGSRIVGRFLRYKELIAVRRDPGLVPGREILTVGVSGLILREGHVIFARRADHVTGYPGYYETLPSGGIDRTFLKEGRIDYRAHLAHELFEETGIDAREISAMETFAFILDRDDRAYDICIEISLNIGLRRFAETARASNQSEYDRIEFMKLSDLDLFVEKHRKRIIPATLAILSVRGLIPDRLH